MYHFPHQISLPEIKLWQFPTPRHFRRLGGPMCPHKKKKKLWQFPTAFSSLGGAYVPTQEKKNFGNDSQKTRKNRYQTFIVLSSFTGFLCFVPNILTGIDWANKFLVLARPISLTILIFWTNFTRERRFHSKTEKVTVTIEFCRFEFWIFGPNFPNKYAVYTYICYIHQTINAALASRTTEQVLYPKIRKLSEYYLFIENIQ